MLTLTLIFEIDVCTVDKEVLLGCCVLVDLSTALFGNTGSHTLCEAIVGVQVALHSLFCALLGLNAAGLHITLVGQLLALGH